MSLCWYDKENLVWKYQIVNGLTYSLCPKIVDVIGFKIYLKIAVILTFQCTFSFFSQYIFSFSNTISLSLFLSTPSCYFLCTTHFFTCPKFSCRNLKCQLFWDGGSSDVGSGSSYPSLLISLCWIRLFISVPAQQNLRCLRWCFTSLKSLPLRSKLWCASRWYRYIKM